MNPMIRLALFALLFLLPLDSHAQLSFGAGAPVCTHGSGAAQLKTAGSPSNPCGELTNGYIARVTDGMSSSYCATGGGTAVGLLQYNSATSSWTCIGSGVQILADTVDVSLQDCTAAGVCPNQKGAYLIDTWVAWALTPGQQRDTDGSMWDSGTVNAGTDFVAHYTSYVLASTSTQWSRSVAGPTNPGNGTGFPNALCRDSVSPFAPCGNLIPATCERVIGSGNANAIMSMLYDASADDYWPLAIANYTGCTAATTSITPLAGTPIALTTSDSIQLAMPDGVHGDVYYHRWLAQLLLNASEEFAFYPAQNLIADGGAETACNTTTWSETGAGALGALALDVMDVTAGLHSVRGNGCQLSGRTLATDSINTPSFAVTPGRIYVAKGYLSLNSASANAPIIEVFDQTPTVLNTSEVTVFHILSGTPIELTNETPALSECWPNCYVVVKFRAGPSQTLATIRVRSTAGTDNMMMDEWFAFPSPTQNMRLNPLIKDGLTSLRVLGDSRSNATTDNEFGEALDDMLVSTRPGLALTREVTSAQDASNGRKLSDVVAEGFSTLERNYFGYTLIYLGINDASQDRTPAQYEADMQATVRAVRKTGSVPIWLIEPPYKGDTTSNTCGTGGTTNCAITIADYIKLITQNATFY